MSEAKQATGADSLSNAFLSPQYLDEVLHKLYEQKNRPGLYVVATPIGNIFDISLRAIHILNISKCILAEDTRQSKKLLHFYKIKTPLMACHEHNELNSSVTSVLKSGEIYALISDAGTPLVSDPGYRLINWCIQNNIDVFPIPGACSAVAALSVAGLPTDKFMFVGFLPPKEKAKINLLNDLKNHLSTMIFFESPRRVVDTMQKMKEVFGDRSCCVCRELTKIFEDTKRGNLSELIEYFLPNDPVGEFVIAVSGCGVPSTNEAEIFSQLKIEMEYLSLKEAVKKISATYNINRNEVYKKALSLQSKAIF
ncbi:ribosomal RNA small subunit methyltransferase I [Alphaproteobacteria bacterium]|nr:ribosomal RNA small subunit methyltransferase I [Alphaproteobacteria bacterium]